MWWDAEWGFTNPEHNGETFPDTEEEMRSEVNKTQGFTPFFSLASPFRAMWDRATFGAEEFFKGAMVHDTESGGSVVPWDEMRSAACFEFRGHDTLSGRCYTLTYVCPVGRGYTLVLYFNYTAIGRVRTRVPPN